jgi:sulfate permease, SulP family
VRRFVKLSDEWLPRSVLCLRDYSIGNFGNDLIAGITVGLVALPLAMAFGIASGVTPQAGLYTAVVAGFLISALGGSRTQIGGPTGAFVVIVAGIVSRFGLEGLSLVTALAGLMLMLMGLTGLGSAVKFIPRPGHHRFYERHRVVDCVHPDQGFSGIENGPGAQ